MNKKSQVASAISMILVYITIFFLVLIFIIASFFLKVEKGLDANNPIIPIEGGKGNVGLVNELNTFLNMEFYNGMSVKQAIKQWSLTGNEDLEKAIEKRFLFFRAETGVDCARFEAKKDEYEILYADYSEFEDESSGIKLDYGASVGVKEYGRSIVSIDSPEYWVSFKLLNLEKEVINIKFYLGEC